MVQLVRKGRWKPPKTWGNNVLATAAVQDIDARIRGDYANWLIARRGQPMVRALIRARQRYAAGHPRRARLRQLHTSYSKKSR